MSSFLSLASQIPVYSTTQVESALKNVESAGSSASALKRVYQKMLAVGGTRFVSKPASADVLTDLADACPNFRGVCEDLRKYIELSLCGKTDCAILPVLLTGDPGVGKTHFAKALSRALGVPYKFVSMGTLTAGWILSGSAPTWSGARYGKVAEAVIDEDFANPLFLLDELDKSGGDVRYDPFGALLQLLEKETAVHFKDEFLDIEIDTSAILWVATANNLSLIPDYIQSRMMVYEVPAPTLEEGALIAKAIYSGLLKDNSWPFDPVFSSEVEALLAKYAPRDMKKALIQALGAARIAKRDQLSVGDFETSAKQKKTIGFTSS